MSVYNNKTRVSLPKVIPKISNAMVKNRPRTEGTKTAGNERERKTEVQHLQK